MQNLYISAEAKIGFRFLFSTILCPLYNHCGSALLYLLFSPYIWQVVQNESTVGAGC